MWRRLTAKLCLLAILHCTSNAQAFAEDNITEVTEEYISDLGITGDELTTLRLEATPRRVESAEDEGGEPNPFDVDEEIQEIEDINVNLVENAIESFEKAAIPAMNALERGILPEEEINDFLDTMVPPIERMIDLLKDSPNVYKFLEARGIPRVIVPYLHVEHTNLRAPLLKLTQLLFEVAPTTTSKVTPIVILDKLLDIFEDDDNLAIKATTMNVLFLWLPENPKVQARVMIKRGLEPFFDQIHKLDATIINTQMKLLSKVLKEHIKVINGSQQKSATDLTTLKIYKNIGLLERLSSNRLCIGLFIIFKNIWENNGDNHGFLHPVFEIISDIQPYCIHALHGRTKTIEMLQEMYEHMNGMDQNNKDYYERRGLNTTDFKSVLKKYVEELVPTNRDEF